MGAGKISLLGELKIIIISREHIAARLEKKGKKEEGGREMAPLGKKSF